MIKLNSTLSVKRVKPAMNGNVRGLHLELEAAAPAGDPRLRIVIQTPRGPVELPPGTFAGDLSDIKPGQVFEVVLNQVGG